MPLARLPLSSALVRAPTCSRGASVGAVWEGVVSHWADATLIALAYIVEQCRRSTVSGKIEQQHLTQLLYNSYL